MIYKVVILSVFFVFFNSSIFANVIGNDAQNFAPTQDGIDFVTVHASETLDVGVLNFGFFINYAENTFPAFEGTGSAPTQSLLDKNDSFTSADINIAIGLFKDFQVGISLPYVIDQSVDSAQNLGRFEGSGTSEIRPSIKYRLHKGEKWSFASVLSANINRIENNPYLGQDAGPTTNLEFVADRKFAKWNWGINLGHRWRDPGTPFANTGIDPLTDQWVYSSALSYLLDNIDTKVIGEIYGSTTKESTPNLSNRQSSSLEALLGMKHAYSENTSLHLGLGTQIAQGTSTPDWRIYTGINISLGPLFNKPSGVVEEKLDNKIMLTVSDLRFKFNSDELTEESQKIIDKIISQLQAIRNIKSITVEGHTDSLGTENYNQVLSKKRADIIKQFLTAKISKNIIVKAIGVGELNPIADNGNYQGRQKNRRVEIKINKSN